MNADLEPWLKLFFGVCSPRSHGGGSACGLAAVAGAPAAPHYGGHNNRLGRDPGGLPGGAGRAGLHLKHVLVHLLLHQKA